MCSFREQYALATSHGVGRDDKVSDKLGKVCHSVRRTRNNYDKNNNNDQENKCNLFIYIKFISLFYEIKFWGIISK